MRALLHILPAVILITVAAPAAKGDDTEPELPSRDQIREFYQESTVDWPTIPRIALLAIVAAEDRLFFERPPQFSTITRQIGSWYVLPGTGKLQRVARSIVIGEALSHDEILNWYVNRIFLGQTCFGLPNASLAYFGKPVEELRLEEIAYLAALPKAPMLFHPVRSYDRAVERRDFVISEMLKASYISEREAESAIEMPLIVTNPLGRCEPEE